MSYDAKGNITQIGGIATQTYDGLNRLTAANTSSGWVGLSYDPAGRLFQAAGGATYRFLYDGAQMVGEYDASGNLQRRFIPGLGMDEHILTYEGPGVGDRRWMLQDERRSVVAYLNGSGATLSINTYDEYGRPGAGNAGRFQYTGQMWLPEAQLYHYKARAYAPQLGRFMQTDPIGYGDGANLYAYVGADPVNQIDPLGLETDDLLNASLRMRPDRVILGELRGPEAYTFLRAVNTGHPGSMTTVHADSPERAVEQIALLVLQGGARLRREDILHYVRSTIDVYVQLTRNGGRRGVSDIKLCAQP